MVFPLREHWEREELTASSLRGKTRPRKAISAADHDGAMAGPPELTGKTLGTMFSHRESQRGRGEGGALTTAKNQSGVGSVRRIERGRSRWSQVMVLCAF